MSETSRQLDLDRLLRDWPEVEKSPMERDGSASAVMERIRSGDHGASAAEISDENLCSSPLGQIEGEGHNSAAPVVAGVNASEAEGYQASRESEGPRGLPLLLTKKEAKLVEGVPMTMPADRERDRRSLQDLAKMAQMTPPPPSVSSTGVQRAGEAKKDDSGIVDLAMASVADPGAESRAKTTALASEGLFDDVGPASMPPAPISAKQPVPTIPPAPLSMKPVSIREAAPAPLSVPAPLSAPVPAPISSAPFSSPASSPALAAPLSSPSSASSPVLASASYDKIVPKKKGNGATVGIVIGILTLGAAAAGTFFMMKSHQQPVASAPVVAMKDTAATPKVAAEPAPAPVETAAAAPADTIDPATLPAAETAKAKAAPVKGGAAKVASAKAEKQEDAKISQKDLPTSPAGPAGALGDEMRKAVGDKGEAAPVAAAAAAGPQFAAGSVPQKPSQGAITGAIGAVLPEARGCLGPDDPISKATITFASGGNAQSVRVSGGAAGKPAEACITAALMKAKVAPFAEATYTAPVTVRH